MKITRRQLRNILAEEIKRINEQNSNISELDALKQYALTAERQGEESREWKTFEGILTGMKKKDPEKFDEMMQDEIIKRVAELVGVE
tara:strand:- start:598 stop:858 length:261 start_codon:yes stop_codon:yes gene_type:complete